MSNFLVLVNCFDFALLTDENQLAQFSIFLCINNSILTAGVAQCKHVLGSLITFTTVVAHCMQVTHYFPKPTNPLTFATWHVMH